LAWKSARSTECSLTSLPASFCPSLNGKQHTGIAAGEHNAGLIAVARLDVPDVRPLGLGRLSIAKPSSLGFHVLPLFTAA
jgi:hypothetical protein